jgi:hypothetical protein
MTDTLIYKYSDNGKWAKYYLRANGTIRYVNSIGGRMRLVTPDSLLGIIRLKTWSGKVYLNVDALKKVMGIPYI